MIKNIDYIKKLSLSSIKSYKNYIIFKYFEIKEAYFFTFKFNMRFKLIKDVIILS
jgi:hypothetical protein